METRTAASGVLGAGADLGYDGPNPMARGLRRGAAAALLDHADRPTAILALSVRRVRRGRKGPQNA